MQVIRYRDYDMAWFYFRLHGRKKPLREIVRKLSEERREREAVWRQYPSLCEAMGRDDLLEPRGEQEHCS